MSEEENAIKQSNKKKKQKLFSGVIFGVFIVGIVSVAFWPEAPQNTLFRRGLPKRLSLIKIPSSTLRKSDSQDSSSKTRILKNL